MVDVSGWDSHSISHSWPPDWQSSVSMTRGRPGTVATLCATPAPVPHAGHWRRTDMGIGEPRPTVQQLISAVVTHDNHVWKCGAVPLTTRETLGRGLLV